MDPRPNQLAPGAEQGDGDVVASILLYLAEPSGLNVVPLFDRLPSRKSEAESGKTAIANWNHRTEQVGDAGVFVITPLNPERRAQLLAVERVDNLAIHDTRTTSRSEAKPDATRFGVAASKPRAPIRGALRLVAAAAASVARTHLDDHRWRKRRNEHLGGEVWGCSRKGLGIVVGAGLFPHRRHSSGVRMFEVEKEEVSKLRGKQRTGVGVFFDGQLV